MKNKIYLSPSAEYENFSAEDIVTLSVIDVGDGNGDSLKFPSK